MPKRGVCCAFKNCKSRAILKLPNISFFSFPKEPKRCRQWIQGCNRPDLFEKEIETLHKYYRVCSNHFEDKMFSNYYKNRLQPHAVPSDFQSKQKAQDNLEINSPIKYMQQNEPHSNTLEACRTCLGLIDLDYLPFYQIEADDKLLSVLPEMTLNLTPKSMICAECHESLEALFKFKEKCLQTEGIILRYLQAKPDVDIKNLDLKDVLAYDASHINIEDESKNATFKEVEVDESITIVKHEVDDYLPEDVEVAGTKNSVMGSLVDVRVIEDEAVHDGTFKEDVELSDTAISNVKHEVDDFSSKSSKTYCCEKCDSSFNKSSILRNLLLTHTGKKPYRCEVCNHRFMCRHLLTVHLLKHTAERPFLCTVCGKNFCSTYKLKKHMQTHPGEHLSTYRCEAQ